MCQNVLLKVPDLVFVWEKDLRVSRDRIRCKRHRKRAPFRQIAHFPVDNSLLEIEWVWKMVNHEVGAKSSIYWGRKYHFPWVAWNWVINLRSLACSRWTKCKLITHSPVTGSSILLYSSRVCPNSEILLLSPLEDENHAKPTLFPQFHGKKAINFQRYFVPFRFLAIVFNLELIC